MPSSPSLTPLEEPQGSAFVVTLSYRAQYKGMVGPFADEMHAEAWAAANAPVTDGWTFEVEPVVTPAALVAVDASLRHQRREARARFRVVG